MPDFNAILNTSADEVKAPVALPMGTYLMQIISHEIDEIGQKKTPGVRYKLKVIDAQDDVDQKELEGVPNWREREINHIFWLSADAQYRLKETAEKVFNIKTAGKLLGEIIEELVGQQALVSLTTRIAEQQGIERVYNEVAGLAAT